MVIGILSDIFYVNKKSAMSKIADDLHFYLAKYGFKTRHLGKSLNTPLKEILDCDIVIGVPGICTLPNLTQEDIKQINKKVIPIWHHYIFTPFEHFQSLFFHGFWTEELGYTNNEIGKDIDNLLFKYKKTYLPIGINTLKYFPTRKITKIKKIGFVGRLSNIGNIEDENVKSWCENKRPHLFIDICKAINIEFVSISESKNSDEDGYKLYDDIDLIICTSIEEGGPMGLLESVACKIPFISTNVGLVKEFNTIKTFNTIEEAVSIINDLNSSEEYLTNYINDLYNEIIPNRDWRNLIPKYWLPYIIKKINNQSHYDFIEIGTSDFSTLLQEFPNKKGISIEPIKVYYNALPNPIKGYKLQCAVSDFDGTIEMNWIHPSDIIDHSLPDWLRGCNSIGSHIHRDKVLPNLIRKESVNTITWDTLVNTYDIQSVDLIKIDTEGHDHIILLQILNHCKNTYFRPTKIIFENNELTNKEAVDLIITEFKTLGYTYQPGYDSQLIYNEYE